MEANARTTREDFSYQQTGKKRLFTSTSFKRKLITQNCRCLLHRWPHLSWPGFITNRGNRSWWCSVSCSILHLFEMKCTLLSLVSPQWLQLSLGDYLRGHIFVTVGEKHSSPCGHTRPLHTLVQHQSRTFSPVSQICFPVLPGSECSRYSNHNLLSGLSFFITTPDFFSIENITWCYQDEGASCCDGNNPPTNQSQRIIQPFEITSILKLQIS